MTTQELTIKSNVVAVKRDELNLFVDMAQRFAKAGAFPSKSPEQLFVLMKAGQEMGMSEVESLNSLYIVNGKIEPYGKAMVAMLTEEGYQLSYEDETDTEVTVVATKDKHVIRETVKDTDQIIVNSRATKFSKKNKMRFHGIRMILNFHLAHLIRSTADLFEVDAVNHKNGTQDAEYEEVKPEMTPEEASVLLSECNTTGHVRDLHAKANIDFTISTAVDKLFRKRMLDLKESAKKQTEPAQPPSNIPPPNPEPPQPVPPEPTEDPMIGEIKACTDEKQLNAIYRRLASEGHAKEYLPHLSNHKKQLQSGN